jgi:hypothetical protein
MRVCSCGGGANTSILSLDPFRPRMSGKAEAGFPKKDMCIFRSACPHRGHLRSSDLPVRRDYRHSENEEQPPISSADRFFACDLSRFSRWNTRSHIAAVQD